MMVTNMSYTNDKPLISVATACYNSGKTIEKTIQSVLNQTYDNYEYWIIDGGSTDNTLEIVNKYAKEFGDRLHIISEKDNGIYDAMNKGVKNSNGVMIGLLNSDDYYSENTLELVAKRYLEENYPYIIINGDMKKISKSGEEIYRYYFKQSTVDNKEFFGHPSMFAAKAVYEKIGLYDEKYKLAADAEWQCRAYADPKVKRVLCPHVFNNMREGGASDQLKYRWVWFREVKEIRLKYKMGSKFKIYMQGLATVLRTDIKNIVPSKLQTGLYKIMYK